MNYNILHHSFISLYEKLSRSTWIRLQVGLQTLTLFFRLSQMILDKEFKGILDQGAGCLVVFEEEDDDETYEMALGTLKQMSHVVDSLYQQVRVFACGAMIRARLRMLGHNSHETENLHSPGQ